MSKKGILNYRRTSQDIVIDSIIYVLITLLCITTIYPFWYVFSKSIADNSVSLVYMGLLPEKISLKGYQVVLSDPLIFIGFKNAVIRTLLGTFLSVILTMIFAYPLSKNYFPHRRFWTAAIIFTMYFNGGIIPDYLLIKELHLYNTLGALVLPVMVKVFQLLIVRNFIIAIPNSLEESAKIDGASDIKILFSIIIPLSKPIIATITLWNAVYHWNEWFHAMVYINDSSKQVIQNIMRNIVIENSIEYGEDSWNDIFVVKKEILKASTIMVTTIPILIVYPFLQKYFVKGVMVGSVKE